MVWHTQYQQAVGLKAAQCLLDKPAWFRNVLQHLKRTNSIIGASKLGSVLLESLIVDAGVFGKLFRLGRHAGFEAGIICGGYCPVKPAIATADV